MRVNNYYVSAGDRELPDPQWVYYLYYKMFKQKVAHGNDMIVSLNETIEEYNTEGKSKVAAMKILDDGNFAIAILTPLMKRISVGFDKFGQILCIDASANVNRYGCKDFMIYTNSCAGSLPVGTIILTSESTSVISVGLDLWKSLFPLDALGGRGLVGPKIFMSDDSTAERNALHEAFPQSELLLCIFNILQAAWRYLWNYNHDVPLDYRQTLYLEKKNMYTQKTEMN